MESPTTKSVVYTAADGQSVTLNFEDIRKFLISGKAEFVTIQEMVYFMAICKSRRLNPFTKDCYIIKYSPNETAAIVTSIDYFRKRARAQDDFTGYKVGVVVWTKDGYEKRTDGIVLPDEKLIGAWFFAKPKKFEEPISFSINLEGFIKKTREGELTSFWKPEKQAAMIMKVAESQGLRRAWPDEFQAIYTTDEVIPEPVTIEPTKTVAETLNETAQTVPPDEPIQDKDLDPAPAPTPEPKPEPKKRGRKPANEPPHPATTPPPTDPPETKTKAQPETTEPVKTVELSDLPPQTQKILTSFLWCPFSECRIAYSQCEMKPCKGIWDKCKDRQKFIADRMPANGPTQEPLIPETTQGRF